jgi:hypothetical protein
MLSRIRKIVMAALGGPGRFAKLLKQYRAAAGFSQED